MQISIASSFISECMSVYFTSVYCAHERDKQRCVEPPCKVFADHSDFHQAVGNMECCSTVQLLIPPLLERQLTRIWQPDWVELPACVARLTPHLGHSEESLHVLKLLRHGAILYADKALRSAGGGRASQCASGLARDLLPSAAGAERR
jgi:hypothetical protein